ESIVTAPGWWWFFKDLGWWFPSSANSRPNITVSDINLLKHGLRRPSRGLTKVSGWRGRTSITIFAAGSRGGGSRRSIPPEGSDDPGHLSALGQRIPPPQSRQCEKDDIGGPHGARHYHSRSGRRAQEGPSGRSFRRYWLSLD